MHLEEGEVANEVAINRIVEVVVERHNREEGDKYLKEGATLHAPAEALDERPPLRIAMFGYIWFNTCERRSCSRLVSLSFQRSDVKKMPMRSLILTSALLRRRALFT